MFKRIMLMSAQNLLRSFFPDAKSSPIGCSNLHATARAPTLEPDSSHIQCIHPKPLHARIFNYRFKMINDNLLTKVKASAQIAKPKRIENESWVCAFLGSNIEQIISSRTAVARNSIITAAVAGTSG